MEVRNEQVSYLKQIVIIYFEPEGLGFGFLTAQIIHHHFVEAIVASMKSRSIVKIQSNMLIPALIQLSTMGVQRDLKTSKKDVITLSDTRTKGIRSLKKNESIQFLNTAIPITSTAQDGI